MNEVEKMYENAGIKKEVIPCPAKYYGYDCTRNNWDDEDCSCDIKGYPPFNSEKQLGLIKWLGIRDEFNFYQNKVTKDWVFYDHEKDATHYNFELGLASWVDYLWQDLTEEERKQIKEILSE